MALLKLHFTDDEMNDFLLSRGWVREEIVEESEVNVYQNVFIPERLVKEYYHKDGERLTMVSAFKFEMKVKLLMA